MEGYPNKYALNKTWKLSIIICIIPDTTMEECPHDTETKCVQFQSLRTLYIIVLCRNFNSAKINISYI